MVQQHVATIHHISTIHHDDSVPDTEAVEAPLHDVDEGALDPEPIEERLHSILGDVHVRLMVERHTPAMLEDDDGVLEGEHIEGLLHDADNNALESEIVKGRLSPIQDELDPPGSPMADRQSPAERDDNRNTGPEAVEPRLNIFDDNALESDIIEQLLQIEQDSVPEGDPTELISHTSTDSPLALTTVERRIPELPIEVCEDIVGFLDDLNVQTIANCALVSRRWVPFSRFKLYHCVRLDYRWQWTAFERLVLQPASSDMAVYLGKVQQLWIMPRDKKFLDEEEKRPRIGWREGQERPWTHLVLVECAARLPAVTCILFRDMDWSEHYYAPGLRSGRDWLSLTTLQLSGCKFASVGQLHLFVTAFPVLADLTLWYIELESTKTLHIPKGGHWLIRLELGGNKSVMTAVTRWMAGAPNLVEKLTDLMWWGQSKNHLKTLTEAIDESSLEKLDLLVPEDWPGDLSRFTHLKVLKLRYPLWSLQSQLESVNNIISSLSSSKLEEPHIDFSHSYSEVSSLDATLAAFTKLEGVDDLLSGPGFTHLRRVTLDYQLKIYPQAIAGTSPSSSWGGVAPISDSSSQPDPSYHLVNTLPADSPGVNLDDPHHPFRLYAGPLVVRKIRHELKQLDARGILDVEVALDLVRERKSNADTGKNGNMASDGDQQDAKSG